MRCVRSQYANRFDDPPYLNTICKNCEVAIEHTGANSGITWIEVGSNIEPGSNLGKWECGPCPEPGCGGRVYHQHIPLDVVSEAEVAEVVAGLAQAQASS